MNEMELQTTLDPIEMDMGDPEIEYSPVLPNPEGEPTDDLTKVQIQGNIYQIKDPEVHDWARAEEKPTYTKEEVGLGNVDNTSDMDKPVSTATQTALDNKVDKVAGKGLSEEDFTHTLKDKLDGIEAGAEVNTVNSVAGKTGDITLDKSDVGLENVDNTSDMNKPVSMATQEALQGLASATQTALNGKVDNSTLDNYYTKTETDNLLSAKANTTEVETALDGKVDKVEGYDLMSDTDKTKLDGIEAEANKTIVDNSVTATSTNPVESKAIYNLLNDLLPEAEEIGNPIAISNASGFNAKALTVDFTPIQDLHGYDKPWAGGSGKNKLLLSSEYNRPQIASEVTRTYANEKVTLSGVSTHSNANFYNEDITSIIQALGTSTSKMTEFTTRNNAYFRININDGSTVVDRLSLDVARTITYTSGYTYLLLGYIENEGAVSGTIGIQIESGNQATTWTPYSNICPISGRTSLDVTVNGKNLVFSKIEHCNISNGGLLQSYSSTQYDMHIAEVKANTTYTLKTNDNTFVGGFFASIPEVGSTTYNGQRVVSTTTFTAPIDGYVAFRSEYGYSTAQLEVGSSSTTYEPYKLIDTETINLGGTVYGGTSDVVNGGTGDEWVYHEFDGTEDNWEHFSVAQGSLFRITLNDKPYDKEMTDIQTYCNGYTAVLQANRSNGTVTSYANSYLVDFIDNRFANRNEWKAYLSTNHLQIAYKKPTPTTINTPATSISLNKGNNTLSTSGDNMDLKYSKTPQ